MIKRNKYSAERTRIGTQTFDSKREARRYTDLRYLELGCEIKQLQRQVKIPLLGRDGPILTRTGKPAHYVADFTYLDARTGREVIEDAKGFQTAEYKLKRAILAAQGITIMEV